MHVQVDQSGKIGAKGATVLALSNDIEYAIFIPAKVKRSCIKALRNIGEEGKTFYLQLFTAALFLLLKDHISHFSVITIDSEYHGRENDIKRYLLNLFRSHGKPIHADRVRFRRIGKKSKAHLKALQTYRGILTPNRFISMGDLFELLKGIDQ